jgi:hypothetical protein
MSLLGRRKILGSQAVRSSRLGHKYAPTHTADGTCTADRMFPLPLPLLLLLLPIQLPSSAPLSNWCHSATTVTSLTADCTAHAAGVLWVGSRARPPLAAPLGQAVAGGVG